MAAEVDNSNKFSPEQIPQYATSGSFPVDCFNCALKNSEKIIGPTVEFRSGKKTIVVNPWCKKKTFLFGYVRYRNTHAEFKSADKDGVIVECKDFDCVYNQGPISK